MHEAFVVISSAALLGVFDGLCFAKVVTAQCDSAYNIALFYYYKLKQLAPSHNCRIF